MKEEVKKAISLFIILFLTWQGLYFITISFPILSQYWLLAYLIVLMVAVCFFILDKQKAGDLGLRKTKFWKKYIAVGFVLAVSLQYLLDRTGRIYIFNRSYMAYSAWHLHHSL